MSTSLDDDVAQIFRKTSPANLPSVIAAISANIAAKDSELNSIVNSHSDVLLQCVNAIDDMKLSITTAADSLSSLESLWPSLLTSSQLPSSSSLPLFSSSPLEQLEQSLALLLSQGICANNQVQGLQFCNFLSNFQQISDLLSASSDDHLDLVFTEYQLTAEFLLSEIETTLRELLKENICTFTCLFQFLCSYSLISLIVLDNSDLITSLFIKLIDLNSCSIVLFTLKNLVAILLSIEDVVLVEGCCKRHVSELIKLIGNHKVAISRVLDPLFDRSFKFWSLFLSNQISNPIVFDLIDDKRAQFESNLTAIVEACPSTVLTTFKDSFSSAINDSISQLSSTLSSSFDLHCRLIDFYLTVSRIICPQMIDFLNQVLDSMSKEWSRHLMDSFKFSGEVFVPISVFSFNFGLDSSEQDQEIIIKLPNGVSNYLFKFLTLICTELSNSKNFPLKFKRFFSINLFDFLYNYYDSLLSESTFSSEMTIYVLLYDLLFLYGLVKLLGISTMIGKFHSLFDLVKGKVDVIQSNLVIDPLCRSVFNFISARSRSFSVFLPSFSLDDSVFSSFSDKYMALPSGNFPSISVFLR
ncbi:hypothetical protein RCL1_000876 [Eukaryota sp. TZLM3-RCL]